MWLSRGRFIALTPSIFVWCPSRTTEILIRFPRPPLISLVPDNKSGSIWSSSVHSLVFRTLSHYWLLRCHPSPLYVRRDFGLNHSNREIESIYFTAQRIIAFFGFSMVSQLIVLSLGNGCCIRRIIHLWVSVITRFQETHEL